MRLTALTNVDLPMLAKAIVGVGRHQVSVTKGILGSEPYVRFNGPGVNLLIRAEEWDKVIPFIADGSFDPNQLPDPQDIAVDIGVTYDASSLDLVEPARYGRIMGVLRTLFPRTFPTSKL